jgi:hypothetical protein
MRRNLVTLAFSIIIALSALDIVTLSQQTGLHIEAPSEVISGEKFKIVITYGGKPQYNVDITVEGAVVEPTKTDQNGVAILTAPNVTKPTKITINIRYTNPQNLFQDMYDYTTVSVLPTKETREKAIVERSTTLFEGKIAIAGNSYWSSKYNVPIGGALVIDINPDGSTVNEYVLTSGAYSMYLENRTIHASSLHQYNVAQGRWVLEWDDIDPRANSFFPAEANVVFENLHAETVSVSVKISRTEAF